MRPHPTNKRRRGRDRNRYCRTHCRQERFGTYYRSGFEMDIQFPPLRDPAPIRHLPWETWTYNWRKKKFEKEPEGEMILGGSAAAREKGMSFVKNPICLDHLRDIDLYRGYDPVGQYPTPNPTLRVTDLITGKQYYP